MIQYSGARATVRLGVEIKPIGPHTRVTVVKQNPLRFLRGRVKEPGRMMTETEGGVMAGFSIELEEPDKYTLAGQARTHIIWSIDVERATEGVGWCRGWDGPDVEAFKAHTMLVESVR